MNLTTTTTTTGSQVVSLYVRSSNVTIGQGLQRILGLGNGPSDVEAFPWQHMEPIHVTAIRAQLAKNYKPATVNVTLAALRGLFKALYQSNVVSADHYQKVLMACKNVRGSTEKQAGRYVSDAELQAMLSACDNDTVTGLRDKAMILLLFTSGLRANELCNLDLDSLEGDRVLVDGKGNKQAYVPLHPKTVKALADYISLRGNKSGPLFQAASSNGLKGSRLTRRGLNHIIYTVAEKAKIDHVSSHDGRRKVASDLFDRGVDIVTVQAILRHADPKTTARYDRRSWDVRQEAIEKLLKEG